MPIALVLNAPELDTEVKEDAIIAADGGYRHVEGKNVIAVIGDLDTLKRIPENVKLIRYPVEKNATDGELAIEYAASRGITELNVYGGLGGKPEHVAGNLNLLAFAFGKGIRAKLVTRDYTVYYATGTFRVRAGEVFAFRGTEDAVFTEEACRSLLGSIKIPDERKKFYAIEGADHSLKTRRGKHDPQIMDEMLSLMDKI